MGIPSGGRKMISKYLNTLTSLANPALGIPPEAELMRITLNLIATGDSPELRHLLDLATADGDAESIKFFTDLLNDGSTEGPDEAGHPFGNDKEIQFNDGGAFGSDSRFTFDKNTGILELQDIKTQQNWLTAYWSGTNYSGPPQPGILADSTLRNAQDVNTFAILFGSTDVSSIGNNQAYISTDVGLQTGSNLGDTLSLNGSHGTGHIWIHTGDIVNDTSGSGYMPGTIFAIAGRHMIENFGGGMLLDSTGIGSQTPTSSELWTRSTQFKFHGSDGSLVMNVVNDGKYVDLQGNPLKNIASAVDRGDALNFGQFEDFTNAGLFSTPNTNRFHDRTDSMVVQTGANITAKHYAGDLIATLNNLNLGGVGHGYGSGYASPGACTMFGNYLFIVNETQQHTVNALVIYEMSNPENPDPNIGGAVPVGAYSFGGFNVRLYSCVVSPDGNTLYAGALDGFWYVFDISDKTAPTLLNTISTGGQNTEMFTNTSGDRLYVLVSPNEIITYDVSTPATPSGLNTLLLAGGQTTIGAGAQHGAISVLGNTLYIAYTDVGPTYNLGMYDISTGVPVFNSTFTLPTGVRFISTQGTHLYGAASGPMFSDNKFYVFNVSSPFSPGLLGQTSLVAGGNGFLPSAMAPAGTHVALGGHSNASNFNQIASVDVSNPSSPTLVFTNIGVGASTFFGPSCVAADSRGYSFYTFNDFRVNQPIKTYAYKQFGAFGVTGDAVFRSGANTCSSSSADTGTATLASGPITAFDSTGDTGDAIVESGSNAGSGLRGKVILDGRYIDATSKNISNVADPVNNQDAATKSWVEANIGLYTTANNSWWATSSPTTVKDALDRIAAVVSLNGGTPIP